MKKAAIQHGLAYLLKTQLADGSWLVPSRIHDNAPVSPGYFETGFPHGKDQIASCSGTSWATMALSLALPLAHVSPFRLDEVVPAQESWTDTALFGSTSELRKLDPNRKTASGTTVLMLAAGDEKKVRMLLDNGADVNARAKSGYSALIVASSSGGNAGVIRLLLDRGARLDPDAGIKVLFNRTPLIQAVISGDLQNVKGLIERGADIQQTSLVFGTHVARPLGMAVFMNDLPTVAYLVERGAAVNEADQDGVTPIDRAALFGRADMVKLLGRLGGNPNTFDKRGMTPLIWASTIEFGNAETVSKLLAAGAQADLAGRGGVNPRTSKEVRTERRANGSRAGALERTQMNSSLQSKATLTCVAIACSVVRAQPPTTFRPEIPRVWQQSALETLEVPVSQPAYSPKAVSEDYYYKIPAAVIYKSYPIYAPGRGPAGYLEKLKGLAPEIAFDTARLKSREDWIRAGEIVFDASTEYGTAVTLGDVADPEWYKATGIPLAKDGSIPWMRYVIRGSGNVELGVLSCGFCHTRVLADGTIAKGAQSNFSFDKAIAFRTRRSGRSEADRLNDELGLFTVQWEPAMQARLDAMSSEDYNLAHEAIPPGVFARDCSSPFYPPAVPNLIGVRDRKYLDRAGGTIHRTPVDLMRYASMAQGIEFLSNFGGFIPSGLDHFSKLPPPESQERFSDAQLYALALYLYSLKPPPNPNRFDAAAEEGRKVFGRTGCAECHPAPVYTNNKLLPVDGFQIPPDHRKKYDVLDRPIGTDPRLTLQTRRDTGYYKVPSLRGVWYHGPFEHNGSVATLDDWFDLARLRDDYVPTGFKGVGVSTRAIKGHEFGLRLRPDEKAALIAYLKTL